jgi:hypothetical protein
MNLFYLNNKLHKNTTNFIKIDVLKHCIDLDKFSFS